MTTMSAVKLTGVVENGRIRLNEPIPTDMPPEVEVILLYEAVETNGTHSSPPKPLAEQPWEAFQQQFALEFSEAMVTAGYDTPEKVSALIRQVKLEQAKELGLL